MGPPRGFGTRTAALRARRIRMHPRNGRGCDASRGTGHVQQDTDRSVRLPRARRFSLREGVAKGLAPTTTRGVGDSRQRAVDSSRRGGRGGLHCRCTTGASSDRRWPPSLGPHANPPTACETLLPLPGGGTGGPVMTSNNPAVLTGPGLLFGTSNAASFVRNGVPARGGVRHLHSPHQPNGVPHLGLRPRHERQRDGPNGRGLRGPASRRCLVRHGPPTWTMVGSNAALFPDRTPLKVEGQYPLDRNGRGELLNIPGHWTDVREQGFAGEPCNGFPSRRRASQARSGTPRRLAGSFRHPPRAKDRSASTSSASKTEARGRSKIKVSR